MVVVITYQSLCIKLFQDIEENICFTIYPYKNEVIEDEFEKGKGDPNYSLERHVGQRLIKKGTSGTKVTKNGGTWIYTPTENTQPPPFGHILNHCRKHPNSIVSRFIVTSYW